MAGRTLERLQQRYNSSAAPEAKKRGPMPQRHHGPGAAPAMGKPKDAGKTIGRIFSYIGKFWPRLIVVALCLLLSTAATMVGGYLLRPILNQVADVGVPAAERVSSLLSMLIVLLSAYLVAVLATFLQYRLMVGVSQSAVERIRHDLFAKLQKLPVRYFDSHNNGEIMSRFTNDVDNIGTMLDNSVISMISGAATLLGTLVMMIYTNVWLTLITVVFLPLFFKGSMFIMKRSRRFYSAQQAALGAVNGYIEETVAGQKVVKVFNHEGVCEEEFGRLNDDLREKQAKALFFGGIMGPVMGNISKVSYSLTAGIGGVLCVLGRFDVGGLAIFVNYASQFARPINELSQQVSTVFSALAGAERVFQVMDENPEEPDAENAVDPVIEGHVVLDDVSFGYVPEKTVLRHISLYARPGQKIAFVGSTGAGKTTITNLLNRFYDIESTIMENIRYGRLDATDEEVIAAAKTASAHGFIKRLSDGYNTVIEGDGANLSQGQRQLLNIARAALSKAPILVLDEATSSVDTRTERMIEKGMDRIMENRTTFVIAHRLSTVRNANAIMVLENGEIIERGDHDDLLRQKGRYYELCTGLSELS